MDDLFGFEITFLDMKILGGIVFILMGWLQWSKEHIPDIVIKGKNISVKIWTLISAFTISYLGNISDKVVCPWTKLVLYTIAAISLSTFGYEILKGTKLGLRSSTELKNGKDNK